MTRRTFLQASIAAAAASAVPASVTAQRKLGPLGLQLYSVRDLLKQDFAGTLQKIAAIGFKEVEFAGLFGLAPADVKALARQEWFDDAGVARGLGDGGEQAA